MNIDGLDIGKVQVGQSVQITADAVEGQADTGVITNETKGEIYQAAAFPPFIQSIVKAGGLLKSLKERGA